MTRFISGVGLVDTTNDNYFTPGNFAKIKRQAKTRNIPFNVSYQYLKNLFSLQQGKCVYTNIELTFYKGNKGNASLDRIDSNIGYVIDNVQWLDKRVNIAKNNLSEKDFFQMIESIYKTKIQPKKEG